MPSLLHHALVDLVRGHPALAVELLQRVAGAAVPAFRRLRVGEAGLDTLQPAERRADLVLELLGRTGAAVLCIAVEVQLRVDERKWLAWLAYLAALRPRGRACVLVVTPHRRVASWAARRFDLGPGNALRVWVVGPDQLPRMTDRREAARSPELAVLSAMAHGNEAPAVLGAAAEALVVVEPELAELYCALLSEQLRAPVRRALEEEVMDLEKYRDIPRPAWLLRLKAEGRQEGRQEGREEGFSEGELAARRTILARLAERAGLRLTAAQRRRVAACRDIGVLDAWIDRVAEVGSAAELFGPASRARGGA